MVITRLRLFLTVVGKSLNHILPMHLYIQALRSVPVMSCRPSGIREHANEPKSSFLGCSELGSFRAVLLGIECMHLASVTTADKLACLQDMLCKYIQEEQLAQRPRSVSQGLKPKARTEQSRDV